MTHHNSGDPIQLSASTQNRVEAMANAGTVGFESPVAAAAPLAIVIRGRNESEDLAERFSIVQTGDYIADPDAGKDGRENPSMKFDLPEWSELFGRIAIALQPINEGKFGPIAIAGVCPATVNVASIDHEFAAPDPDEPTRLMSCDTGEVRIVGKSTSTGVRTMMVELSFPRSVLWTYERTEDYPGDAVKLRSLSDDEFSGTKTVDLLDPQEFMDDQSTGDRGNCIQVGSKFYAIQAVC